MSIKKIIYVTGTRADYGLMQNILKKLNGKEDIELSICVTGMHLSELYGDTIKEIEQDGLNICATIPVNVVNTTPVCMAQTIGHEILSMSEIFEKQRPDLIMLLGDRGEMLAAAITAVHLNIPIIHLHGGERSGTVDEMVRHAISKLSHYHFVATKNSRQRLIKMGEKDEAIFVLGAPGLEALSGKQEINRNLFCQQYNLDSKRKIALFVYHPVVQEYNVISTQFNQALDAALEAKLQIICLEPNSDAGGQLIREKLQNYSNHIDIRIINHLPRPEFINCLAHVDLMMGNSSSGIIEAATFNLTVINIGTRQNLRECSDNVIQSDTTFEAVLDSIKMGLSQKNRTYNNVYGGGAISERCYQLIKSLNINSDILSKCNAF